MRFAKYLFYVFGTNLRTKHPPYVFEFFLLQRRVWGFFVPWDMTLRHWVVVPDVCKECSTSVLPCRVSRASCDRHKTCWWSTPHIRTFALL